MATRLDTSRGGAAAGPGADPAGVPASQPGERRARLLAEWPVLLLLLPLLAVLLAFWPGHMSGDTLAQVDQARGAPLTNQHSPLLNAIWREGWDLLGAGTGWVLFLQVATFLGGAYLLLRGLMRPLPSALLTVALALFPAVFGMLGYVSRDVWFTSGLLMTFGLVSLAGRQSGRARALALAAAVVFAFFTTATRQNAAPALWPACILMAALVLPAWRRRRGRPPAPRRRALAGAVVAGSLLTVALPGVLLLATAPLAVYDYAPQQQLFIYDLAALSEQDRDNLFPRTVLADRGMATIDSHWNVDTVGPFVFPPSQVIQVPLRSGPGADLSDAWRDAALDDPIGYLHERTDLFLRQIALTRRAVFIYHPQIDPNQLGLQIRFPELNDAAKDYVEFFATPELDGGVIHMIWLYLAICLVGTVVLLRRGRPWAVLAIGATALGVVAYQSGLFFGAMATQFRWEWPVVVVGLLTIPGLVVALRSRASMARPG